MKPVDACQWIAQRGRVFGGLLQARSGIRQSAMILMAILFICASEALADVYVVTNNQGQTIKFSVPRLTQAGTDRAFQLPPGTSIAIPGFGQMAIHYQSEVGQINTRLQPNTVYNFDITSDSRLLLKQLDLGGDASTASGTGDVNADRIATMVEIPVKILVDDDEPAQRAQWEERLRKRVTAASQVLERTCRVRLRIVEVGTWLSDNRLIDFNDAFQEFSEKVELDPARLVIGFSSQFPVPDRAGRVGLSAGLLRGFILMREGARRATESEMAEALLQEIARTLGAVNQNVNNSVMRPEMLDGQARRKDFELQFDPVNLLLINMLAEEIRRHEALKLADLQPGTRARLKQIYTRLGLAPKPKAEENVAVAVPSRAPSAAPAEATASTEKKPRKRIAPHPDLSKFQGKWKVVSATRKGEPVPEALLYSTKLVDDTLTLGAENLGAFKFRMDIDPDNETSEPEANGANPGTAAAAAKKPSQPIFIPFDLIIMIQGKPYVAQGIYQFDGTQLRVCIARPGKDRPRKLASPADLDQAMIVFQRPGE